VEALPGSLREGKSDLSRVILPVAEMKVASMEEEPGQGPSHQIELFGNAYFQ
jgi:hypothetical protein